MCSSALKFCRGDNDCKAFWAAQILENNVYVRFVNANLAFEKSNKYTFEFGKKKWYMYMKFRYNTNTIGLLV